MHDPAYPESLPAAPLVRYTYTEAGELLAVYDRSNTQVRAMPYDAQHSGPDGGAPLRGKAGDALPLRRYGAGGGATEPGRVKLPSFYSRVAPEHRHRRQPNRREVLHVEGGAS